MEGSYSIDQTRFGGSGFKLLSCLWSFRNGDANLQLESFSFFTRSQRPTGQPGGIGNKIGCKFCRGLRASQESQLVILSNSSKLKSPRLLQPSIQATRANNHGYLQHPLVKDGKGNNKQKRWSPLFFLTLVPSMHSFLGGTRLTWKGFRIKFILLRCLAAGASDFSQKGGPSTKSHGFTLDRIIKNQLFCFCLEGPPCFERHLCFSVIYYLLNVSVLLVFWMFCVKSELDAEPKGSLWMRTATGIGRARGALQGHGCSSRKAAYVAYDYVASIQGCTRSHPGVQCT